MRSNAQHNVLLHCHPDLWSRPDRPDLPLVFVRQSTLLMHCRVLIMIVVWCCIGILPISLFFFSLLRFYACFFLAFKSKEIKNKWSISFSTEAKFHCGFSNIDANDSMLSNSGCPQFDQVWVLRTVLRERVGLEVNLFPNSPHTKSPQALKSEHYNKIQEIILIIPSKRLSIKRN